MAVTAETKRVVRNAAALATGGVVAQILFVSCEALIARNLGAEAYGIFSSVYALVLILCFVIEFGMNWKLVEDGSRDPTVLGSSLGTMLAMALAVFAIVYPVTIWAMDVFGDPTAALFTVFAFFALSLVIQDLFAGVYGAVQRMEVTAVFQTAVPAAILVGMLLMLPELSLSDVGVMFAAGSGLVTIVWAWVTFRYVRPRLQFGRVREIVKGSYQYGITGLLTNLYLRSGVLVLAAVQDPKSVALFAAAHRLMTLGFKVPVLVTRVIAPKLFADMAHKPDKFKSSSEILMRFTAATSALMAVGIFTASDIVIRLVYGHDFAAAGGILQLLGVALALKTVAQIGQTVITAADDHAYRTRVVAVVTVLGTLAAIPLSMAWGPIGAAVALLGGDFVWSLLILYRLRLYLPDNAIFRLVAMPVFSVGLALGVATFFPPKSLTAIVICPLLAIAVLALSGYLQPVLALFTPRRIHVRAE